LYTVRQTVLVVYRTEFFLGTHMVSKTPLQLEVATRLSLSWWKVCRGHVDTSRPFPLRAAQEWFSTLFLPFFARWMQVSLRSLETICWNSRTTRWKEVRFQKLLCEKTFHTSQKNPFMWLRNKLFGLRIFYVYVKLQKYRNCSSM
jgi:hypothetical protein